MDKAQAQPDAIARIVMEPDLQGQDAVRRKKAIEASLARKRRIAWCSLAGSAAGAAIANFNGLPLARGVVFGGFAGCALGWLITSGAEAKPIAPTDGFAAR
ncbi:hypothetical protein [Roseateles sp.]|uniref:hypothetical protein n=1 Tax=Roseateles sp. TaxID=1971397 RepID=UPI00395EC862